RQHQGFSLAARFTYSRSHRDSFTLAKIVAILDDQKRKLGRQPRGIGVSRYHRHLQLEFAGREGCEHVLQHCPRETSPLRGRKQRGQALLRLTQVFDGDENHAFNVRALANSTATQASAALSSTLFMMVFAATTSTSPIRAGVVAASCLSMIKTSR